MKKMLKKAGDKMMEAIRKYGELAINCPTY